MSGRFTFTRVRAAGVRRMVGYLLCGCCAVGGGRSDAATPEQVDAAIARGKEFLYTKQKNGAWEDLPAADPKLHGGDPNGKQFGGVTALVTLSLLSAGESPQEPRLKTAIEFLKKADIRGGYALGMRAQVWNHLPPSNDIKQMIARDAGLIIKTRQSEAHNLGLHGYFAEDDKNRVDHSVSQYGVLGLWACAEAGLEVPQGYWSDADTIWRTHQNADGGWTYNGQGTKEPDPKKKNSVPSMAAAGVATLFITQDFLRSNAGVNCSGNVINDSIELGMKYMSTVDLNKVDLYTLYGIERIGVASGYKYLGANDWYELGAERLVKSQGKTGAWPYKFGNFGKNEGPWAVETVGTSFSLLFLSRGRAPLVASKLSYEVQADGKAKEGRWNQRPRDLANVVHWIGKQMERPLNWQIVSLKAPAIELLDSSIIYVAGSQPLSFTDEESEKLKWFIRNGGMIVGNADCSTKEFADSFRMLGTKLFPDYEFRSLPANHSILTQQQFVIKNKEKVSLLLLGNGAREYMALLNANDPGKAWQLANVGGKEESFQIMANLFQYAAGKTGLRFKGETYVVAPDPKAKTTKTLEVARLEFDGNWDPEPGGWERLDNVLRNTHGTDLTITPVKLGEGKLNSSKFKVAHLTSTDRFKLDDKARAEVKNFVEAGGTLLADATGGNPDAARSLEAELTAIFGAAGELLPPADEAYTAPVKVGEVKYRAAARAVLGKLDAGRIRAIKVNGRTAVYFSGEDFSVGLVGTPVDGIVGYAPATATQIVSNILLNAVTKPPAPKPAEPAPATKPAPQGGKKIF